MAPHSSTLAWKIPWMEEPGGLQSVGSHRVGHDWSDLAAAAAAAKNRLKNKHKTTSGERYEAKSCTCCFCQYFFSSHCLWKENKGCHLKGHECLCQNCGCFLETLNMMLEFLILVLAAFYHGALLEAETLSIDNAFLFYGSFWGCGKKKKKAFFWIPEMQFLVHLHWKIFKNPIFISNTPRISICLSPLSFYVIIYLKQLTNFILS